MHLLIRVLMILVFLEAMADVVTTSIALKLPNVHEANPVMAFFMRALGSKWVLARLALALVAIVGALTYEKQNPGSVVPLLMLLFNFALMAWVIWNNLKVIRSNSVNSV